MKTYVFPGQGSQRKGMGENLFDDFGELINKADKILGYSIKDLCLNNTNQQLNQTEYTQPAMYVVNALSYLKTLKIRGKKPDFLAGHSLGEYSALHAAGVFSFEIGLKLVKKRGELMSRAKNGAMAAIINISEKQILKILEKANLTTIDIANLNAPSQTVISGLKEDVNKAQSYFEKENAKFIHLNTSGAFHSRYMKEAESEFKKYIERFEFSIPEIPVISNVTAKPYESNNVGRNLTDQITNCVRWSDSIMYLLDQGEMEFEEMGVGDVLTKLINHIRKDLTSNSKDKLSDNSRDETSLMKEEAESKNKMVKPTNKLNESLKTHELVEYWNKTYPIGTKVFSDLYETELETRTEAMVLFGHRAAVYMKGYNGYFDLREVTPIE